MSVDWGNVQGQFLLPEGRIYLNSATFGAMPRPVLDALVHHIRDGESDPTRVAAWRGETPPIYEPQKRLAAYLGCNPEDMVFHYNITNALNQAFFSLPWKAGGEILASDHEYGSMLVIARTAAERNGLTFRQFKLPPRPSCAEELRDCVMDSLSPATTGVLLSHICTGSGLLVPVEEVARELSRRGIRFIVDGAHGPGRLPLRLGDTAIDVYGGNLHKWFMGPKGTAFLYVKRSVQYEMRPHIVGYGGSSMEASPRAKNRALGTAHPFPYVFGFQGVRDSSPFLAISDVLDFRHSIGEEEVLKRINELTSYARRRLIDDEGYEALSPAPHLHAGSFAFRMRENPAGSERLSETLFQRHGITIGPTPPGQTEVRISPHIWNSEEQIERFVQALRTRP